MKQYIFSAIAICGSLLVSAQDGNNPTTPSSTPQSQAHNYEIINNGEVITITDKTLGKTQTYSAYDTLHYAVVHKIMQEREAAKKQATPTSAPPRRDSFGR